MSTKRRTVSRDLRSASPVKQAAPAAARPKATPRKRKSNKKLAQDSVADSADEGDDTRDQELLDEVAEEIEAAVSADAAPDASEPLDDNKVRVSITSDVVPNDDDTETTRTTVRVEMPADAPELKLPKDTEGVVAIARDIIDGAKELQDSGDAKLVPTSGKKSQKRKAEAIDETDVQSPEEIIEETAEGKVSDLANGKVEMHTRPTKRTRVMVPAEEYRREKVKRRALMGLSGALAVGVMIPFLSNLL